jgi:hypothetical protein
VECTALLQIPNLPHSIATPNSLQFEAFSAEMRLLINRRSLGRNAQRGHSGAPIERFIFLPSNSLLTRHLVQLIQIFWRLGIGPTALSMFRKPLESQCTLIFGNSVIPAKSSMPRIFPTFSLLHAHSSGLVGVDDLLNWTKAVLGELTKFEAMQVQPRE